MIFQNYCMLNQENICENVCIWDGNLNTWEPPAGYTMLVQSTTPAMIWDWDGSDFILVEVVGAGGIGFTWNGSALITNQPKPQLAIPATNQSTTTGTQTL